MLGIAEIFSKTLKEFLEPSRLITSSLETELNKFGIQITADQRKSIEAQIGRGLGGIITLDFSDEQVEKSSFDSEKELESALRQVGNDLGSLVLEKANNLSGSLPDTLKYYVSGVSQTIVTSMIKRMDSAVLDQDVLMDNFLATHEELWGEPLKLMRALIIANDEAAAHYMSRSDRHSTAGHDLHDVLVRIYARAILVSKEVLVLLERGFSDAAESRWRKLHELTVNCIIIKDHGETVAKKFLLHESIGSYKAAMEYNELFKNEEHRKITSDKIEEMHLIYTSLLEQYGDDYRHQYGWASQTMGMKKPTFRNLEKFAGQEYQRPYYKMACANVHANAEGVFQTLGLHESERIVLAGPSNRGLSRPAELTLYSLNIIAACVLTHRTTIDYLVTAKVLDALCTKARSRFEKASKELS